MVFWTLKIIFSSLIFIAITHSLYLYFKNNLTQPKVKDFVHQPKQYYNDIFNTLNKAVDNNLSNDDGDGDGNDYTPQPVIDNEQNVRDNEPSAYMQNELNDFLKNYQEFSTLDDITSQNTLSNSGYNMGHNDFNNFSFNG